MGIQKPFAPANLPAVARFNQHSDAARRGEKQCLGFVKIRHWGKLIHGKKSRPDVAPGRETHLNKSPQTTKHFGFANKKPPV